MEHISLKWINGDFVRYMLHEIREEMKLYLFCGNNAHPNGTINVKLKINKQNQLRIYSIKQLTFSNCSISNHGPPGMKFSSLPSKKFQNYKFSAGIYLFKVNNGDTKTMCEFYWKLTIIVKLGNYLYERFYLGFFALSFIVLKYDQIYFKNLAVFDTTWFKKVLYGIENDWMN